LKVLEPNRLRRCLPGRVLTREQRMSMPADITEVFGPLRNEVIFVHAKWGLYRQLFATSPDRIDLLNRCASEFVGIFQEVLYDDVLMALFRLTEAATTCGRDNCTLSRLLDVVKSICPALATRLEPRLVSARANLETYRDWRNKRIGHNDLHAMCARMVGNSRLQGPSREEIEGVLQKVRGILNGVQTDFEDAKTYYGPNVVDGVCHGPFILTPGRDGEALLKDLEELERRRRDDPQSRHYFR
jgi:hypothetical protein